jgi:hypothetical protein
MKMQVKMKVKKDGVKVLNVNVNMKVYGYQPIFKISWKICKTRTCLLSFGLCQSE